MRTEKEIFEDFKELGYSLKKDKDNNRYVLSSEDEFFIIIGRKRQWYCKKDEHTSYLPISVREHKLLHELFKIWGWL